MIAILEDRKGFRKYLEIPAYVPIIYIPVPNQVSIISSFEIESVTSQISTNDKLEFMASGDIQELHGTQFMLYKEMVR
jgi:hypothetical protein